MRRGLSAGLLGVALLGLAPNCSLMGLGEFEIGECIDHEQCQPLNDAEGIGDAACRAYQCRQDGAGCELTRRDFDGDGAYPLGCAGSDEPVDCDDRDAKRASDQVETCDGIDNDCDQVIDEGLAPGQADPLISFGLESPASVFFSTTQSDVCVTVSDGEARSAPLDLAQPALQAPTLEYRSESKNGTENDGLSRDKTQCPQPGNSDLTGCNFREAVAARVGSDWLVASVSTPGCREGLLRIGHLESNHQVLLRGPAQHSNLFEGVDSNGDCTGESRSSGVLGVARPAIAARQPRDDDFPQALVVLVADQQARDACAADASDVEVLGVFLEDMSDNGRAEVRWTSGTNDGVPQSLGTTAGAGRPVVLASNAEDTPGYLLAYPEAGGGLALNFIEGFRFAPDNQKYDLADPDQVRTTAPLSLDDSQVLLPERTPDYLALSLASVEADHLRLGLSWLEEPCTSNVSVHFAELRYFWATERFELSEPLEVASKLEQLAPAAPAVIYEPSGFLTPAFENDGGEVAGDHSGGFVVAWSERSSDAADVTRIRARRILDLNGQLLEEPPLALHEAAGSVLPHLFHSERTHFAAYQAQASELYVGKLLCKLE